MKIKTSRDGFPIEQDNYNLGFLRMFEDFVETASPEIRKEIQRKIEKAVTLADARFNGEPWVDFSRAVDLGDGWQGWGRNLLYVWVDKKGTPFYVGQARNTARPGEFEYRTRSEEFQAVIREGGCHSVVVAKHIPGTKINALEEGLISFFAWKRYPLVNRKGVPSALECSMAEKVAKTGKMTLEDVFLNETEYRDEFELIFSALSGVIGASWDGECAEFKPKAVQSAERVSWNGQEKTYLEWSREPGVTVTHATIRARVEKGWTFAEALFTPSWDKVDGESMAEKKALYDSYRAQARAKGERMVG